MYEKIDKNKFIKNNNYCKFGKTQIKRYDNRFS
jgi:hypothetical protein